MNDTNNRLFVGVGGYAVVIDSSSGAELWRTKLKASSFVTVWLSGNRLYSGAGGELFCLDPSTGTILWRNRLKGLGMGVVALLCFPQYGVVSAALSFGLLHIIFGLYVLRKQRETVV